MAMQIRPNSLSGKIVYAILQTPKDLRQHNRPTPPESVQMQWAVDARRRE